MPPILDQDSPPRTAALQTAQERKQYLLRRLHEAGWNVGNVLAYAQGRAYECALAAASAPDDLGRKRLRLAALVAGLKAMQQEIAGCLLALEGAT